MKKTKSFSVIGAGSWGTTIASLLAKTSEQVKIFSLEESVVTEINNTNKTIQLFGLKWLILLYNSHPLTNKH